MIEANVSITCHQVDALTDALSAELGSLASRAYPGERLLGRYCYDSPPNLVFTANIEARLVAFRSVVMRETRFRDQDICIAGIGIAVDPDFRRRGIGSQLTSRMLEHLDGLGIDLVLAFLLASAPKRILERNGFVPLTASVNYSDRLTGANVCESMPCYARSLRSHRLIERIEAERYLHIGTGTW